MELDIILEILEKSVEKNGEKPLTNKWLLNIIKQAQRQIDKMDNDQNYGLSDIDWQ